MIRSKIYSLQSVPSQVHPDILCNQLPFLSLASCPDEYQMNGKAATMRSIMMSDWCINNIIYMQCTISSVLCLASQDEHDETQKNDLQGSHKTPTQRHAGTVNPFLSTLLPLSPVDSFEPIVLSLLGVFFLSFFCTELYPSHYLDFLGKAPNL